MASYTPVHSRWSSVPSTPTIPAYSVFNEPIEKPAQDARSYRLLRLQNGLEAMLIHDKDADTSAAAMDIAVGHLNDPASHFATFGSYLLTALSRTICLASCVETCFLKVLGH